MGWGVVFVAAVVLGWAGTRAVRAAAPRLGLVDAPDGRRKLQTRAIPVGGGLAVLFAAAAAVGTAALLVPDVRPVLVEHAQPAGCLLIAAVLIAGVGLLDDAFDLRARYKLLGQIAAVSVVVFPGGLLMTRASLLGADYDLGWLAYPVTYLWFLAAINALNLLDGMDGLLGTVGVVVCGAFAVLALLTGQEFAGLIALALAGGLLGFLRYNLPPATIYLGDAGSMVVGLVIAALAVQASLKSHAVALMAPTAILVLPFLDTTAAIVRRQLSGRGWAAADRDHLHHVLLRGGLTARRVLLLVAGLGIVAASGAVVAVRFQNDLIAVVTAAGVVLMLVISGLFGSAEVRLIRQRTAAALAAARGSQHTVIEVRVPPQPPWAAVWQAVEASAAELHLTSLTLDTFDGREPFRGRWNGAPTASGDVWKAELALRARGLPSGRVFVTGVWDVDPVAVKLATLSRVIETTAGGDPTPTPRPAVRFEPNSAR